MNEGPPVATEPALDIDAAVQARIRARIRAAVAEVLAEAGIPPDNIEAYVNDTALRNDLIRTLYDRGRASAMKAERLTVALGEKFGLSYSAVHRIVHDRKRGER